MDNTPLNNNERMLFLIACRWYKNYCYMDALAMKTTYHPTKETNKMIVEKIAEQATIKLSPEQIEELVMVLHDYI